MGKTDKPSMPAEKMSKAILADINQKYRDWFSDPLSKGGAEKVFATPQALLEVFKEYVEWQIAHPWYKSEWKNGKIVQIPCGVPFTMMGFCLRVGISQAYFDSFEKQLKKDHPHYDAFIEVIHIIKSSIRKQKFDGAAVGAFNARFISYDLGMIYDHQLANGQTTASLNVIVVADEHEMLLEDIKAQLEKIDEDHDKLQLRKK